MSSRKSVVNRQGIVVSGAGEYKDSPKGVFRLAPIGLASYQRSYGLPFIDEKDYIAHADYDSRVRVLVSEHRYGMRWDLAGKKVAVVGNGTVQGCGALIDNCDEILRISTMRNWQRSPLHDGIRITTWTGYPWFVFRRNGQGEPIADPKFAELVENGTKLWAASPFHVSLDAYRWLDRCGCLDALLVAPPPANVYEIACSRMAADDLRTLFSIAEQRKNIVGLPYFDLLLTGTRVILLLELCGVTDLSIFGINLFNFSKEGVWFGHDLDFDHRVLLGVKKRIVEKGGNFYWHEEKYIGNLKKFQ